MMFCVYPTSVFKDTVLNDNLRSRFENLKKEGIFDYNKQHLLQNGNDCDALQCQKSSSSAKIICSFCRGFYNENTFYKHRMVCRKNNVIGQMKPDKFLDIIRNDDIITFIGKELYQAKKPNKEREAKIKARTVMRIPNNQIEGFMPSCIS